ncbi:MBL fold metallo-hydrolase [Sphingomonas ginkgonis]|uniref:MBL fold metallo-hydrolase n=1 Tax=Sphingomonas ginkgonis TaxID=2315330 RepID=A0A3R9YMG0_9SPHN|nr:MBL fold metallo-hydrolase [Sphingomonas ginkgonis]RST31099.1 MBL fold metallo-hydrolase [Sphingomonas ginkgonis]
MKVRILGCGTSSGVPRIGEGGWGRCDPAEARNRRLRSSILVETAGESILVDAGPDMREQLIAAGTATIDRVVITHDHADHCHGIDDLRQLAHNRDEPVTVYARADVLQRLEDRFRYLFHGTALYPPVAGAAVLEGEWQCGGVRVRFVDQPHGRITSVGMRFDEGGRSLGYAIDFHDVTPAMADLYVGVDVWIADALRRTPHPTHAHLDATIGWAREIGVKQLYLSHMDNSMDWATLAKELPSWAAPAFDGQEILL